MRASRQNRITVAGSITLLVALSAVLGSITTEPAYDLRKRPSTFFTDATGARALLLVMQRLLSSAEQWRQPLRVLPDPRDGKNPNTLIVAGPEMPLSAGEAARLEIWIHDGGQLVLLTTDGWSLKKRRRPERTVKTEAGQATEENPPIEGAGFFLDRFGVRLRTRDLDAPRIRAVAMPSRDAGKVSLSVSKSARWSGHFEVFAGDDENPIAIRIPHGDGRIIALGDPGFLSNKRLGESDNAVWLVSLCASWGNGRVAIDEYHHGFRKKRGPGELTWAFLGTPWGWATAQLLAAGLLYAVLFRKRMGRVCDPPKANRRSPLQLLEARAGLLRSAEAQRLAADLIGQHLCEQLDPLGRTSSDWRQSVREMCQRDGGALPAGPLDRLEGHYQSITRCPTRSRAEAQLLLLAQTAGQIQQHHHRDSRKTDPRLDARSRPRAQDPETS